MTSTRVAGDRDDLVLAELEGVAGVLDERGDVGGQEVLALADPDDERGVAPGGDHPVGVLRVDRDQGERALQPAADVLHRRGQVPPRGQLGLDEVGGDLGVGLGEQLVPGRLQLGAQRGEVLDDPVVHQRDPAGGARGAGGRCASLGAPWVAQRVCPMPVLDSGSGWSASALSRFAILPARFSEAIVPSWTRATPAES